MGITNLRYGLENRIALFRGELEAAREEVGTIENGVARLGGLHQRIAQLETLINAAEVLVQHDNPDWKASKVKALKPRAWNQPFKSGEIGRTALSMMRETGQWLRPSEIAKEMLKGIDHDPEDRAAREKLTNSIGSYLRKYEGDLVVSRGDYAKEWAIRDGANQANSGR